MDMYNTRKNYSAAQVILAAAYVSIWTTSDMVLFPKPTGIM